MFKPRDLHYIILLAAVWGSYHVMQHFGLAWYWASAICILAYFEGKHEIDKRFPPPPSKPLPLPDGYIDSTRPWRKWVAAVVAFIGTALLTKAYAHGIGVW